MAPVAAVLCGREPNMVQYMIQNLQPQVESESSEAGRKQLLQTSARRELYDASSEELLISH